MQLFPCALIACIREGRLPQAEEVATLSAAWADSVSFAKFKGEDLVAMARLALGGGDALAA
jgi:hypothetical protein